MGTSTIQNNILYGLGEGINVANTDYLTYALRWANAAYRDIFTRYRFKHIQKRTVFRTANGQQTYQAPANFSGFLTLKDETNDSILIQVTPEEFARDVSTTEILDETFTSSHDTAVSLAHRAILQYSETIANNAAGTITYTRDTDYTMNYVTGAITVLSTGSMATATTYYANYLYHTTGTPSQFCLEYDSTNKKYVFRLDPTPDAVMIGSLVYPDFPTALSASVDPIWDKLEYALERGGIAFGSLEIIEDAQLRAEFRSIYEGSIQALIQLDQDLVPKHDRIKVVMRKSDY